MRRQWSQMEEAEAAWCWYLMDTILLLLQHKARLDEGGSSQDSIFACMDEFWEGCFGSGIRSSGLAISPDVGPTLLMPCVFSLLFLCTQPSSVRYGPEDQDG